MDIVGKESLERLLKEYKGTLIFISHDRYFVNKIADSLLIFEKNKVVYFEGTYDEYIQSKTDEDEKTDIFTENKIKNTTNEYFLSKERNRIKNKIKKLESEISNFEDKIKLLEQELQNPENASNYIKLTEIQDEIQDVNNKIEEKMEEWANLENELENL